MSNERKDAARMQQATEDMIRMRQTPSIAEMQAEISRLQEAKRRALDIADERAKEANGLRQQLASASERVAEMQYEAGMYHSLYEVAGAKLAQIAVVCTDNMGADCNHRMALDFVRQLSKTDEKSKP